MKVTAKIERSIHSLQDGVAFRYQQLNIEQTEYVAATKALERLIRKGSVKRVSKGLFYKPRKSAFGLLGPGEKEILKHYLFQDGKRIAYVTGLSLYNRLGLTSQIPGTIKVASRAKRITTKIGSIAVKPIKSYVDVTDENFYLLEILDAIKDFKKIPDLNKRSAITILRNKIDTLQEKDLARIINYALNYPPRVKAFLGAILESTGKSNDTSSLKKSLNPLSTYHLGIKEDLLPTAPLWNIT